MSDDVLLTSDLDGVRTVTLNRPDRKNAINARRWEEPADAFRAAARDTELRALVITGAGGAFCSGADIGIPEDIHPRHKLRRLTDVALANEARAQPGNFATADSTEAYVAFAAKRDAVFTGQWALRPGSEKDNA